MDDSGQMYVDSEEIKQALGDDNAKIGIPNTAIPITNPEIAKTLAKMNRKSRRAFMVGRRHGLSEEAAMLLAEDI